MRPYAHAFVFESCRALFACNDLGAPHNHGGPRLQLTAFHLGRPQPPAPRPDAGNDRLPDQVGHEPRHAKRQSASLSQHNPVVPQRYLNFEFVVRPLPPIIVLTSGSIRLRRNVSTARNCPLTVAQIACCFCRMAKLPCTRRLPRWAYVQNHWHLLHFSA